MAGNSTDLLHSSDDSDEEPEFESCDSTHSDDCRISDRNCIMSDARLHDNWRPKGGGMMDFQNEARKRDLFTDIQFVIGKGESSKTFRAHKTILACGSPVFEIMFFGETPEKRSIISIQDDDPVAFEMLLRFLYGDRNNLQILSFNRAFNLYIIGDKYSVPGIQTIVTDFILSTTMSEDSFWEIIQRDIYSCDILVNKLISFIQVNACNLMVSKKVINMPEALINIILKMDELNITEYQLLTSVTKWAYHYIGSDTNSIEFLKYFQHIRFSILTADDFSKFISVFPNALDTQSSLDIFKHLNDKCTYQLPLWCSTSNANRNDEVQLVSITPANSEGHRNDERQLVSVAPAISEGLRDDDEVQFISVTPANPEGFLMLRARQNSRGYEISIRK